MLGRSTKSTRTDRSCPTGRSSDLPRVYAMAERVIFGPSCLESAGRVAGAERELSMIADRKGHLPHSKVLFFAGGACAPSDYCVADRGYLLLIDRENPLSDRKSTRLNSSH